MLGLSLGVNRRATSGGSSAPFWDSVSGWTAIWDPTDSDSITESSGRVTQIDDLSTVGNDLPEVSGLGPTLAGSSGSEYLSFSGSNRMLAAFATSTVAQPQTIFFEGYVGVLLTTRVFVDGDSAGERRMVQVDDSNQLQWYGGAFRSTGDTMTANNWHVITAIFNTTSSVMRLDGTEIHSTSIGTHNMSGIMLGAKYDGTSMLNGRIGGMWIKDGVASAGEISTMETGMSLRRGVSLP